MLFSSRIELTFVECGVCACGTTLELAHLLLSWLTNVLTNCKSGLDFGGIVVERADWHGLVFKYCWTNFYSGWWNCLHPLVHPCFGCWLCSLWLWGEQVVRRLSIGPILPFLVNPIQNRRNKTRNKLIVFLWFLWRRHFVDQIGSGLWLVPNELSTKKPLFWRVVSWINTVVWHWWSIIRWVKPLPHGIHSFKFVSERETWLSNDNFVLADHLPNPFWTFLCTEASIHEIHNFVGLTNSHFPRPSSETNLTDEFSFSNAQVRNRNFR